MKITFVLPGHYARPIGSFTVIYEYANRMAARGHEVTVVHPLRWDWRAETIRLTKAELHPLTKLHLWLRRKIRLCVIPMPTPKANWYSADRSVRLLYVPEIKPSYLPDGDAICWYGEDCPPEKGDQFVFIMGYGVFDKALEDALFRVPVPKIVIAPWLYQQALELGVPPDELTYIPPAIDHARYRLINPIEERPQRVAMLYSESQVKGSHDGIRALELAKQEVQQLRAVLFGVSPRPQSLPSWIEYSYRAPLEELVDSIYNGSSIYLCPSWSEGWHLPPAEAMACGCAVVSTDIGGVRDYAEHAVTALLSPPGTRRPWLRTSFVCFKTTT